MLCQAEDDHDNCYVLFEELQDKARKTDSFLNKTHQESEKVFVEIDLFNKTEQELEKVLIEEVTLYKEMYKLAKEKRASRRFIEHEVLTKGFLRAALSGYLSAKFSRNMKYLDLFKKECDTFVKVGVAVSKSYGPRHPSHLEWRKRETDLETWIKEFMLTSHAE